MSKISRMELVNEAVRRGYTPTIELGVVTEWDSETTKKTQVFSISEELWLLNCVENLTPENSAVFTLRVFDAKTKLPFTQLKNVDYLGMRTLILEGPGEFYLEVEGGKETPVTIEVMEISVAE